MIYALKTMSGREDSVVDMMALNIKNNALDVKAVLHPTELKGYVFVEGNLTDAHKACQGLLHVKSFVEKPINLSDIQRFLEVKKVAVDIGDEVEICGGAFKGDRGIITRIDKTKDEVTIELREGAIPIPMTIAIELIKVTKKAERKDVEEKPAEKKIAKKFSFTDLKKSLGEEKTDSSGQ